ncbi:MAG TPA: amidohydrolase [Woeseiaceae bacterium]|nr:amidohydrolase [Woeseiaceae bacterium]
MQTGIRALLAVLIATLCLSACGEPTQPESQTNTRPADLVLRGGKIVTVDPAIGTVEALAVDGFTIAAAGSDAEIAAYIGPQTRVIELDGRFAMPGFIEGHGHFMSLGRSLQILDLSTAKNWDEIVAMVAAAADKAEAGEWIFGRGWHQEKWDSVPEDAVDGVPVNDTLSAASPDNPVLLDHASGHAAFANDAALAAAFIDDDTPDPPGGTIVRSPDGEATGLLRETAQGLLSAAIEQYNDRLSPVEQERLERQRVELAGYEALSHGVTSFHDAGESFETIDFFRKLEAEGVLPVRLYVMVRYETNEAMDELLPHYRMTAEGNDFLAVRSIKRQIDGALGSHGAWLLEPYTDMPDSTGLVLEPVEEIERTAEIAIKHGFQLATHAIGTRANREVLDLYERAWDAAGVDGSTLRWRIEHAQHLHPDDVPRFAELGVIAAMQGVHATSDGPWIPSRLGEERGGETSYVWRDLLEAGTIIGNGTDVPVEHIDPIASFYSSVSRMMANGQRFHPEQAMTREEALRSYTINNAYAAFEEDIKGTLTPGKLADVVVLSQDILTIPEARIPETVAEITIVGGEIRYQRKNAL